MAKFKKKRKKKRYGYHSNKTKVHNSRLKTSCNSEYTHHSKCFFSFIVFVAGKPPPWGIKIWCSADPASGFLLDFDPYLGKIHDPMPHGLGHHVIMKMASRFLDKGHHLYFDNYFFSVRLAQDLERRGMYMCSTARLNRKNWLADLSGAVAKRMKSGNILFWQNGNMLATMWKDKRPVAILSTNCQPEMVTEQQKAQGGR